MHIWEVIGGFMQKLAFIANDWVKNRKIGVFELIFYFVSCNHLNKSKIDYEDDFIL